MDRNTAIIVYIGLMFAFIFLMSSIGKSAELVPAFIG